MMTVVGREKMVVFDDMELEHKITIYDKAPEEPTTPTASGEREPATVLAEVRTARPLPSSAILPR